ncbi:type III secretion system export apparatus subunit SctT [Phyllobacterium sp. 21LDTY02-6]|jgi:type III secretion protein T|uniref:type III secretion system export apparatus subunit SctT n=1 Tax=unclassified Phyllobacterium TaxID=2638441 RepID=UPI00201FB42E|nr:MULTISPECIES: type III secretion system export apparatus subunit SctT [unclassified Phyllobacterium]MCO4318265.1 type III secretion system export apparatus subunit SctT [Phyllobacterium sp. 21LDTY02-6]MCX8280260.1 type III secretion system export apparatus subunit SctT [Phyllobacterium sp. 0TCS1.6C]MCX8294179.1 type III secretion system export apparatus subunit SctT [Phyllobacterium sp. 0TCS1.6A]
MDAVSTTTSLLALAYPVLVATAMAMARAIGMILVTPAFIRLGLTGLIRSGVAIAICIPIIPGVLNSLLLEGPLTNVVITGLLVKETVIGIVIGLAFGIPFWAAEVAGDLVDLQRGSTSAQLIDPLQVSETSIAGTLFVFALLALFFMSGGFLLLLDGFYQSYELWPVTKFAPVVGTQAVPALLGILDRIMQIGLLLIAPVVLALLLTDVMLAYLSRMSPQLHIFDLSLAIKNLLFAVLMVLYISYLVPYMMAELKELRSTSLIMRSLME